MVRDIIGYEGRYSITVDGMIWSYPKFQHHSGKFLCPHLSKNGYYVVNLTKPNKGPQYIHRLLAQHFIDNPNDLPVINHIDGNKSNNNLNNLEWCTHEDNMKHAFRTGLSNNTGKHNGMSKLNNCLAKQIYILGNRGDLLHREVAKRFGISKGTVGDICRKHTWKHIHEVSE